MEAIFTYFKKEVILYKFIYFGAISIFADISIDKSWKYEIELFRDWKARTDLSRPRNRPRVPSLVDSSRVYFELRLSLV